MTASEMEKRFPAAFIVGAPRSGTTLLRLMLDQHPEMAIPHESHFLHHVIAQRHALAREDGREDFFRLVTNHWAWPSLGLDGESFRQALEELAPFNLQDAIRAFYQAYAARFQKVRWGDKTPDYSEIIVEIQSLLPEARFVHLVRDGRDVAVSARRLWFGAGEKMLAQGRDWAERVRTARWNGEACNYYLEVHYESLVREPEKTLRLVCDFLELSYSESMLNYHTRASERLGEIKGWPASEVRAQDLLELHGRVSSPPLTKRIGRWKSELQTDDLADFEFAAGAALREFGYQPTSLANHMARVKENRVSGLLLTDRLPNQAFEHFLKIRDMVDSLVIFVDTDRASVETRARARELGTRVYETSTGAVPEIRQEMYDACEAEWVLRFDSDEQLSAEWFDDSWRTLLEDLSLTHFSSPRRWLLPSGNFIAQPPWWPDWQMRLFRKDPGNFLCRGRLHLPMQVRGNGARLRTLAFDHLALCELSRTAREEKVRRYDGIKQPGGALGHYYLFENFTVEEEPLPASSDFDVANELLRMDRLENDQFASISIKAGSFPGSVRARECFWIKLAVSNHSRIELNCGPPFPVNIAYHWLEEDSGRIAVFDGARSPVYPEIRSGETRDLAAFVAAPSAAGSYRLQITLVQEGVAWFETVVPGFLCEGSVLVVP